MYSVLEWNPSHQHHRRRRRHHHHYRNNKESRNCSKFTPCGISLPLYLEVSRAKVLMAAGMDLTFNKDSEDPHQVNILIILYI